LITTLRVPLGHFPFVMAERATLAFVIQIVTVAGEVGAKAQLVELTARISASAAVTPMGRRGTAPVFQRLLRRHR